MRTDGVAECTDVVDEFHAIGDTPEQTDSNRARSNEANRAFWSRVDELGLGDTMTFAAEITRDLTDTSGA